MYRYAYLDNGICTGEATYSQALESPGENLIEIPVDGGYLGRTYQDGEWSDAPQTPAPPEPRRITVGAFFDRFGAAKWGILADTTPTVAAVVKDASVRKYIDLDNPDLPAGIALLQQAGHDVEVQAIIAAPVQDSERP